MFVYKTVYPRYLPYLPIGIYHITYLTIGRWLLAGLHTSVVPLIRRAVSNAGPQRGRQRGHDVRANSLYDRASRRKSGLGHCWSTDSIAGGHVIGTDIFADAPTWNKG